MKPTNDKDAALRILSEMSEDDPKRSFYVKIAGFDPNDKWAAPVGDYDTSKALSGLLNQ